MVEIYRLAYPAYLVFIMRRWRSYSLELTKEPEFAQRLILYTVFSVSLYSLSVYTRSLQQEGGCTR